MMGKAYIFKTTKRQQLKIEHFPMFLKYQSVLKKDANRNKEQNYIFKCGCWDTLSQGEGWSQK